MAVSGLRVAGGDLRVSVTGDGVVDARLDGADLRVLTGVPAS
ncbi:MAG TPA: hypothetical protein VFM01_16920 [Nakamurella sp.]|nr:hypothetical protein [Nakamurella sp.]